MRLIDLLAGNVPAQLQERGRVLHRKGAVFILGGSPTEVRARVLGTRLYMVQIILDPTSGAITPSCDCPYFEGGAGFCKHLWACFLSAREAGHLTGLGSGPAPATAPARLRPDPWEMVLRAVAREQGEATSGWPACRRLDYEVEAERSRFNGRLTLNVAYRDRRRDGTWGKAKPLSISARTISDLPEAADREILSMILGAAEPWRNHYGGYGKLSGAGLAVPDAVAGSIVPAVCRTGRGWLQPEGLGEPVPLKLDGGAPWELCLQSGPPDRAGYPVAGVLRRGDETFDPSGVALLGAGGFLFAPDGVVYALADPAVTEWLGALRRQGPLRVPAERIDDFLAQVMRLPRQPALDLPPELEFERLPGTPRPRLQVTPEQNPWSRTTQLRADLSFDYQGLLVDSSDRAPVVFKTDPRRLLVRDAAAEAEAAARLADLGLRLPAGESRWLLAPKRLPAAVRALTGEGWHVEAEGSLYRAGGAATMRVSSGVDWFELEGSIQFAEQVATLPELLAAMRRGEEYVRLGDGSIGLVPEEWLAQYRAVAGLGTAAGEGLRFKKSQVGVIDALLATRPEVSFDETFRRARQELLDFDRVRPMAEPPGFVGTLRPYQRDGLGWFDFLARMGFGGCLADDMGLGKTVQVLARLQARAGSNGSTVPGRKPSLVVVPKSLVFNWLDEAQRFTPGLKVLNHTGQRDVPGSHFEDYHLVVTTYGTLRRDIAHLAEVPFDYCILDEAQAIKNPATAAAKAARLIVADHRLALSGTPIENHLGELWSLFDFLNPGMLGSVTAFRRGLDTRDPDPKARKALARALRPFLLRRTKEQVAGDLPPKTELTQYCELAGAQRRQYDQLRNHYRKTLLARVDREGMNQSKMFVLEALLRLRQAACHPGLVDPKRRGDPSAKLDLLIPQLLEVVEEGHKALVFSQFTSFLAIVRERLDREKIAYEYLDGKTADRQARVASFQNDPDRRLFLISLKAGGLGLNLTAAEYVFLLDPWWNPAVEAQAVDRAHRIGQTKPVMAYRIITRDTVEEKVLQLQQSKRELADAIIGADNSLIRKIRREDLELLLS